MRVLIAALLLTCPVFAQEKPADTKPQSPQIAEKHDAAPKPEEIALSPEALVVVKELRANMENVLRDEQLVLARKLQIQAQMAAHFNRLCAKAKVDPDDHEWNETMTGIRRKVQP